MKFIIYLCGLWMITSTSFAHPTSFQGSKGVMGFHSPSFTHNQVNYSMKYWFAVGAHHYTRPNQDGKKQASFVSSNFLLKRWNASNLQANLYTVLGAGESRLDGNSKSAGLLGFQFDIEDRDYYFLVKSSGIDNGSQTDLMSNTVRVGVTPYVDPYDGIHTWLILNWEEKRFFGEAKETDLTPTLRFFYRNLLFEIGQSFKGNTQFNYIAHF